MLRRLKVRLGAFAWLLAALLILWEGAGLLRGIQLAVETLPATFGLMGESYEVIASMPPWVQVIGFTATALIFLFQVALIWLVVRAFKRWRRKRLSSGRPPESV